MSIEMLSKEYINYIKRDRCSAVVELVSFWPSLIVSRNFLTRDMYPTSHPRDVVLPPWQVVSDALVRPDEMRNRP